MIFESTDARIKRPLVEGLSSIKTTNQQIREACCIWADKCEKLKEEKTKLWRVIQVLERKVTKRGTALSKIFSNCNPYHRKLIADALNYKGEK